MKLIIWLFGAFLCAGDLAAASPAAKLGKLVQEADSVEIEFYSPSRKKEVVTFRDEAWLARLSIALASGSFEPRSHCLCVSFPTITLFRGKDEVARFSVHHREKLRVFADGISGDFFVGEMTGKAVLQLANERKEANQPPQRNAGSRPSSGDSSASETPSSLGPRG